MSVEIKMPQMGESVTEGTLVKWFKQKGERVLRDENLFEISTDKVDTEVPSPTEGHVAEIYVQEGETVPVDTPVCRLDEETTAVISSAPPDVASAARQLETDRAATTAGTAGEAVRDGARAETVGRSPGGPPAGGTGAVSPRERVSPAVRRLVREHGVDLSRVRGTGEGGRISKDDILRVLEERRATSGGAAPPTAGDHTETMSVMRKKIAEHMVTSKRTSPHASTVHEADMTAVANLRKSLSKEWQERSARPSFLPFVIQATCSALRRFPVLNSSIVGDEIHYKGDINIGIAVALDDGLIVPVIRRADAMSILELVRAVTDLATRARSKALLPEEVQGGTFTITNPGVFGSLLGTPIIHQPQVAILCVGAVKKRAVVLPESDAIAVRSMAYLSLTFDHRLIDGAVADRFVAAIIQHIEEAKFRIDR